MIKDHLKLLKPFYSLPYIRQFGWLVVLAAVITFVIGLLIGVKNPSFERVYSELSPSQTNNLLDILQENQISFKIDNDTGGVLVHHDDLTNVRAKIASVGGLLHKQHEGFKALEKDSGIGTSRFMESARYKYALEGELAKTIANLNHVKSARVHLAIPKEQVFVKDKQQATASVFLDVVANSFITRKQVLAIQQLVAASITNLQPAQVSVINQNGVLLSSSKNDFANDDQDLQFSKRLEEKYQNKIMNLIEPLVGHDNVRVSVNATIDFNHQFDKNNLPWNIEDKSSKKMASRRQVKASNKSNVEQNEELLSIKKVAKSLFNDMIDDEKKYPESLHDEMQINSNLSPFLYVLKNLTVGVAINDIKQADKNGTLTSQQLSKEQLENITLLIKNAIGFDSQRGDKISVVNVPFVKISENSVLEEKSPYGKGDWLDTINRHLFLIVGVLLSIIITFWVLLTSNTYKKPFSKQRKFLSAGNLLIDIPLKSDENDENINFSQSTITQSNTNHLADIDPKKIALILKQWIERK